MKKKTLLWILLLALTPIIIAGIYILAVKIHGLRRYDEAYFVQPYLERYETPADVAIALESALQNEDQTLLVELQGLRRPARFVTGRSIILVMLWERGDRYISYLYVDMEELLRHTHYLEEVKGRWVVSPADAYYYYHSGRWMVFFLPVAIVWWLLEVVSVGVWFVAGAAARVREERYG